MSVVHIYQYWIQIVVLPITLVERLVWIVAVAGMHGLGANGS